jgi:hypothetical protein
MTMLKWMMTLRASRSRKVALLALGFAVACSGDTTEPPIASSVVPFSGNEQEVHAGGFETAPLVVRVLDQRNAGFAGAPVDWAITQGDGSLSAAATTTDASGYAEVVYASGEAAGDVVISATVVGMEPVHFTVIVLPAQSGEES